MRVCRVEYKGQDQNYIFCDKGTAEAWVERYIPKHELLDVWFISTPICRYDGDLDEFVLDDEKITACFVKE